MPATAHKSERTAIPASAIESKAEARAVTARIVVLMAELRETVQQETALVYSGRLITAGKVAGRKRELAAAFVANVARVRASQAYFRRAAPDLLAALRTHHRKFRLGLRRDLARLATARAIAAGILRALAKKLGRCEILGAEPTEGVAERKAA